MSASKHRGFTLVEMMVVIAIIGILTGLLLVVLGPARAAARNWACQSQMRELGQSVLTFTTTKDRYPGSFESSPQVDPNPPGGYQKWPWVVAVFPHMEQEARYNQLYTNPNFNDPIYTGTPTLQLIKSLMCPSDPRQPVGPQLSYVANMGRSDTELANMSPSLLESIGNGVFHDRYAGPNRKLRVDQVKDGKQHTILLTENINATVWTWTDDPTVGGFFPDPAYTDEYHVGALWFNSATAPVPFLAEAVDPSIPPSPRWRTPDLSAGPRATTSPPLMS